VQVSLLVILIGMATISFLEVVVQSGHAAASIFIARCHTSFLIVSPFALSVLNKNVYTICAYYTSLYLLLRLRLLRILRTTTNNDMTAMKTVKTITS